MGIVRLSTTVLLALLVVAPGLQASGFQSLDMGTRATGMGGAFRAVADDWTAARYNPAGFAFVLDNQLGANLGLIHFRNEITPSYRWDDIYETGILNDRANVNNHELLSVPTAGFVSRLPIWGETVFGLSAYQTVDYNITWQLYGDKFSNDYNSKQSFASNQYQNNLDVVTFQLTAARLFMEDKLSLGVGLQVLRGDLLFSNVLFRDNPYTGSSPDWVFGDRPYDKIVQRTSNDGFGWSAGLTTGMMYRGGDKLTLAATIDIPFGLTVSGSSSLEFIMPYASRAPLSGIVLGTADDLWTGGTKVVDSADFEVELKLPPTFGIGLAYQLNEKLLVAIDAEYVLWSKFDGYTFEYSNHKLIVEPSVKLAAKEFSEFFSSDLSNPVDWSNAAKAMIGASYEYSDKFTFMGGLFVDQSPAGDKEQFSPLFMDLGTKLGLNGGLVYHINEWDLGLSTSYTSQPDASVSTMEDIDGDGLLDSFAGDYKAATYQTSFSINYRF